MGRLFWLTRRIWSVLWLSLGVLLVVLLATPFMLLFSIPTILFLITHDLDNPENQSKKCYIKSVWKSFDVFANIVLLGKEWETFSSRLGKIYWYGAPTRFPKWFVHRLVWMLDKVDKNHCKKSIDL